MKWNQTLILFQRVHPKEGKTTVEICHQRTRKEKLRKQSCGTTKSYLAALLLPSSLFAKQDISGFPTRFDFGMNAVFVTFSNKEKKPGDCESP
jgi:hypothetical protein